MEILRSTFPIVSQSLPLYIVHSSSSTSYHHNSCHFNVLISFFLPQSICSTFFHSSIEYKSLWFLTHLFSWFCQRNNWNHHISPHILYISGQLLIPKTSNFDSYNYLWLFESISIRRSGRSFCLANTIIAAPITCECISKWIYYQKTTDTSILFKTHMADKILISQHQNVGMIS